MPTFATITVNDREDTPVAHSFTPTVIENGVGVFHERDGVPIGDSKLTLSARKTGSKYKARMVLALPVMVTETINSVDQYKVSRTAYADVSFTFDESSSEQERENAIGLVANALDAAQSTVIGVLQDLEGLHA